MQIKAYEAAIKGVSRGFQGLNDIQVVSEGFGGVWKRFPVGSGCFLGVSSRFRRIQHVLEEYSEEKRGVCFEMVSKGFRMLSGMLQKGLESFQYISGGFEEFIRCFRRLQRILGGFQGSFTGFFKEIQGCFKAVPIHFRGFMMGFRRLQVIYGCFQKSFKEGLSGVLRRFRGFQKVSSRFKECIKALQEVLEG